MWMTNTLSSAPNTYESKDTLPWVQKQVQAELNTLQNQVHTKSFMEKNDRGETIYHLATVKTYLQKIQNKSLNQLFERNTGAWAMAVQIALKQQGYDVGKVDGVFATRGQVKNSQTLMAVRAFQAERGITTEKGWPGPKTIKALLENWGTASVVETDSTSSSVIDEGINK